MATTPTHTCSNCAAWCGPTDYEDIGQCRYNPPIAIENEDGDGATCYWPKTAGHHWCGKWIKRGAKLTAVDGGNKEGN